MAISVMLPISAVIYDRVSRPLEQAAKLLQEHLAAATVMLQEMIGGIGLVKAYNLEAILAQKYGTVAKEIEAQGLHVERVNSYLSYLFLVLRMAPQYILPLYGGYLILQGKLTVGELLAAFQLHWYIFIPVQALLDLLQDIRTTTPVLARLRQILDQPSEDLPKPAATVRLTLPTLELNEISFGYPDGDDLRIPVLNDVSFSLHPHELVALVGPSGSGKSTICKLICGFYQPQIGRIALVQDQMQQTDRQSLRQHIAFMTQDTYLFPATIVTNIAYGRVDATKAEIIAAAKAANAHTFITALPQGYETIVGESGNPLSGGQRQRIALARVMLKDAPILLLDEPTSGLDTETAALVEQALRQFMQKRTVLVIAHRLSTIRHADRILVLNEGQIVESGSHDALIAQDSLYRKLYLRQTKSISIQT